MKTTKEAFIELLNRYDAPELLGVSPSTIRTYRKRLNSKPPQKGLSLEKIEELLHKAGYQVAQEKLWTL